MKILGAPATGLLLLLLPALAAAQDFPNKPIRLIVPFPAGGPNDIIARVIGQRMSELTRRPVLIDNRGGQAGVLGTDAVAKANPDGYTIGIVSASALAISPTMEKVDYDVSKDFAPVTLVVTVPEMLAVTPARALPPAMRSANATSARVSCLKRRHCAGVFLCKDRCSGRAVSSRRLAELLSFIVPPLREPSLGPERRMRRRVFPGGGAPSRTWLTCLSELCAFCTNC